MANAPAVAVIMPAWIQNQEQLDWLGEAIDSVLRSSFQDRELFVVDDASPVELAPILSGLPLRYFRMKKHGGPAAARNVGANATRANWLFCLDSDDLLKPDALDKLYAAREENKFVYGDLEWLGKKTGFYAIAEWSMQELRKVTGPIGVTALQSRKLWRALGGWREDLEAFEDIEYWIRAAECGVIGKHIPGAMFGYRLHDNSRSARIRERTRQLIEQVRTMHRAFLEPTPAIQTRKDIPMIQGKVEVIYIGPRLGSFFLPEAPSKTKYLVDGRGNRFLIDNADLEWILAFRDAGLQPFKIIIPEPQTPPIIQPAIDFSQVAPIQSEVPDVTTMNAKDAAAAVMLIDNEPDLRVVEALENGVNKRTTVLNAIEKRRKELVDA